MQQKPTPWRPGPGDTKGPFRLLRECYARALGDCDGGLSREHVIADSVLRASAAGSGNVTFTFPDGTSRSMGTNMTVRYVCRRHNSALAPYCAEAANIARAVSTHFTTPPPGDLLPPVVHEVDGPRLERWAVSTALNVAAATGGLVRTLPPYIDLATGHVVPYLFRAQQLGKWQGLYWLQPDEQHAIRQYTTSASLLTQPMRVRSPGGAWRERRMPLGARIELAGIAFFAYVNLTVVSDEQWREITAAGFEAAVTRASGRFRHGAIGLSTDQPARGLLLRFVW